MIDLANLPPRAGQYLRTLLLERAHVLVLGLARDWSLRAVWGDAAFHGIDPAAPDAGLGALRDLFIGLDESATQELPFVELANGHSVHVHLLPDADGLFVLLLDADPARAAQRDQQQLANEAALAGQAKSKAIDALKHIRSELERQRARLEEANGLKNALIATMSHEFRTPLTSAFGNLSLLEAQLPAGNAQIQALRRSLSHLFALAENLLEYGRGEAGGGLLNPAVIDLPALCADLDAMFAPLAAAKGLSWRATLALEDEAPAHFDPVKLRQILINLSSNALRYTQQGGVALALRWAAGHLHAEITDTGIGIAPEYQARIFRPFNAGAQAGSRGAGLGLSIVRQLVAQMHGTLELESTLGAGSRFRVSLPAAAAAADAPRGTVQGHALIVDDDADIAQLLEVLLARIGLTPGSVGDGVAALAAMAAQPPALLLVDMQLPGQSGCEFVMGLRARSHRGPILMLSADASAAARDTALGAGANAYLTKPIDFGLLETTVRALLAPT